MVTFIELLQTGSESIEVIVRGRTLLGICGAHGGHETAKVRDVQRTGGGRGLRGGQENEWMGIFLDDLRAFGINADQWTTAAQDKGGWRKTAAQGAEQGTERFMVRWIAAEKARAMDYGMHY